jgi:hypothetical protein
MSTGSGPAIAADDVMAMAIAKANVRKAMFS